MTKEEIRLVECQRREKHWKRWGPYLSERAWGTVREDYSPYGNAWEYLPHDHARSRAYRWNEDGLAGICDRHQLVCFALSLWNERDPILKERLFGLTGNEGNHGEDVKEYYFYLDSTPTHSYMKYLYKYPHAAFPYSQLLDENRHRGKDQPEFELLDTGVFEQDRYFDVFVEYAKGDVETSSRRSPLPIVGLKRRVYVCCQPSGFATPGVEIRSARTCAKFPERLNSITLAWANGGSIMTARRNCSSPKTKPMSNACSDWRTATRA